MKVAEVLRSNKGINLICRLRLSCMVQSGDKAPNVTLSSTIIRAASYVKHIGRVHCRCSMSLRSGIYCLYSNVKKFSILKVIRNSSIMFNMLNKENV